jgi:hypothetical protein
VSRLDDLCADMMGPFHAYVLFGRFLEFDFPSPKRHVLLCRSTARASSTASNGAITTEPNGWDPMVLVCAPGDLAASRFRLKRYVCIKQDMEKRSVLKTHVLPAMAANRSLQRVVTKFQLMLSEIDERENDVGVTEQVQTTPVDQAL